MIKRHHFSSNRASHGNSRSHNTPGSIGMAQDPGRVFPGKRMAGQHGNVTRTVQTLKVVRVDAERGLLLVRGSVPGADGGHIIVRPSVKTPAKKGGVTMELKLINGNGQAACDAGRVGRAVRPRVQRGADPPGRHRVPRERAARARARRRRAA